MSERIRIEALKPGMVIVQVTQQNGPVKIRKSGLVSSDAMVQGLAEMGVQEVEIDPEQTVEVDAPVHHRTQTQALLRGQHDTSAKLDHTLSDQFNRSLFLPTVQSLPSTWRVYGKQVLTYLVVLAGGVSIGFTAATHSLWWPLFDAADPAPVVASSPAKTTDADSAKSTSKDTASADLAQTADAQPDTPAADETEPNTSPQAGAQRSSEQQQTAAAAQAGNAQDAQVAAKQTSPAQAQSSNEPAEPEGRVLNQPADTDVNVSAELMARFNKAVEALDNEPEQAREPETQVTVRDGIMRVDQLPARLLTRLPAMNFSAHMYASQKEDRWVRVNGVQMMEGDWIDDRVEIISIKAQHVVLGFENETFKMAALTDW
ncbi:general secretion pathway protein GspB [Alteromonas halophila]|uniref:DUF3391 domain-containing protein n=1 Tax=Alteromonas halophila TaxID=516698 RepID=A0A918MTC2_9ALTE|nr:general secretion pathway protein GspB [Alteromonas halophila]GGW72710.1 hypothetical protein GCM10007391_00210 [Alteromonas halophila]